MSVAEKVETEAGRDFIRDIEGIGRRAEQWGIGLPVGLGVNARNIGHVFRGRPADLDHSCAELQKGALGSTIL